VITCPAYFSAIEVENTMRAGVAAGFEVQEIVKEPTAAAVYYGVEHLEDGGRILVCDLGGGTYDASILTLQDGSFRPLATAGDRELGGHDWTSDLLGHTAELLTEIFGEDPRVEAATEQTLYDACERLKRDFARTDRGVVPCVFRGKSARVEVSRDDFERLTEWRIRQLLEWTEKVLAKASPPLGWDEIDHVLLVGGATRMRRVAAALAELCGQEPVQTAEADTMVALGAAILARGAYRPRRPAAHSGIRTSPVSGLTIVDYKRIAERNLGTRVIVRDGGGLRIDNSAIIPYGTDLPTEMTRGDYQTSAFAQSFFDVPVVEFDDVGPDAIQESWRFECPAALPHATPVHVTFRYDKSGQIDVEAIEQHGRTVLPKTRIRYEEPDLRTVRQQSPPRAVVFALDVSGSMSTYDKLERAKQAVLDNAGSLFAGGAAVEVGVVAFGSQAERICPLTSDLGELTEAVSALRTYGSTAMGAGLRLALELLAAVPPEHRREIVLVSDGMPDTGDDALAAAREAGTRGVRIVSLGLGQEGIDKAFLEEISPEYLVVDDPGGLTAAIAGLLTQAPSGPAAALPRAGITWLGGAA
jgi:molecular chaperone DnaK (HSP70)